jgi:uncharacterized protein
MKNIIKVIFDNNSWISFCQKGRLTLIGTFFTNPRIKIYACQNLIDEFEDVTSRTHLQKYLIPERVEQARIAVNAFSHPFQMPLAAKQISRDPKDDYFLYFAEQYNLDFIVTGDKDLLVLETHGQTQIISFSKFLSILEEMGIV